jgi:general stress protein 26
MKSKVFLKAIELVNQPYKASSLITIDKEGYPHGAAVTAIKTVGLKEFWFTTNVDTIKADNIKNNNKVSINYFDEVINITLTGTATLIIDNDTKREMWCDDWMPYFYSYPENENYYLIKVEVFRTRIKVDGTIYDFNEDLPKNNFGVCTH